MAFHPYMAALGLLFFRALPRIHNFPARIGRPAALFLLLYVISLIQGNGFIIQLTKIGGMAVTFVVIAVSVRSYDDFVAGVLGLGCCAAILCVRGFIQGPGNFGSINPIDGTQKNAFSLFYLPALTLCLYVVFSGQLTTPRRVIMSLIVTMIFAGVLLSKNRSGWLASGTLVLLVFSANRNRLRVAVFITIAICLAFGVVEVVMSETEVIYERDVENAGKSDNLRVQLIMRAISIGFQNPLLGVSPTRLIRMLGTVARVSETGIDCHNLTGYLIGGSGLITFGAFCLFAFAMLRPPKKFLIGRRRPIAMQSARILFIMTIIWLIRAQFQEDVLFSPTFTSALGLCVGFCTINGVYNARNTEDYDSGDEQAR
jgi:O-Antigen ligase